MPNHGEKDLLWQPKIIYKLFPKAEEALNKKNATSEEKTLYMVLRPLQYAYLLDKRLVKEWEKKGAKFVPNWEEVFVSLVKKDIYLPTRNDNYFVQSHFFLEMKELEENMGSNPMYAELYNQCMSELARLKD